MNLETPNEKPLNPAEVDAELHGMMSEMASTGRLTDEMQIIEGLLGELQEDPSRAHEVLTRARRMRAGRQEDADQGI